MTEHTDSSEYDCNWGNLPIVAIEKITKYLQQTDSFDFVERKLSINKHWNRAAQHSINRTRFHFQIDTNHLSSNLESISKLLIFLNSGGGLPNLKNLKINVFDTFPYYFKVSVSWKEIYSR